MSQHSVHIPGILEYKGNVLALPNLILIERLFCEPQHNVLHTTGLTNVFYKASMFRDLGGNMRERLCPAFNVWYRYNHSESAG